MLLILIIFLDGYQLIQKMVFVHNAKLINIDFRMSVNVINCSINLNVMILQYVNGTLTQIHVQNYNVQNIYFNNNVHKLMDAIGIQ